jgi:hypothetical protein
VEWWQWLIAISIVFVTLSLNLWLLLWYLQKNTRNTSELISLLRHSVDLLSVKDPMTYQVVATDSSAVLESDYDPTDEAEIERLKRRGYDGPIYDAATGFAGDLPADEFERIRSEVAGEYN